MFLGLPGCVVPHPLLSEHQRETGPVYQPVGTRDGDLERGREGERRREGRKGSRGGREGERRREGGKEGERRREGGKGSGGGREGRGSVGGREGGAEEGGREGGA